MRYTLRHAAADCLSHDELFVPEKNPATLQSEREILGLSSFQIYFKFIVIVITLRQFLELEKHLGFLENFVEKLSLHLL
jgi:hypothetical protein